jgi:hypothetical protein
VRICAVLSLAVLAAVGTLPAVGQAPPDEKRVAALVRDLNSDKFADRERAEKALRKLGKVALPLLRKELARSKALEQRRRLEKLVREFDPPEVRYRKRLRELLPALSNDRFDVRQAATRELVAMGKGAVPLMIEEMQKAGDAEVRRRLEAAVRVILEGKR